MQNAMKYLTLKYPYSIKRYCITMPFTQNVAPSSVWEKVHHGGTCWHLASGDTNPSDGTAKTKMKIFFSDFQPDFQQHICALCARSLGKENLLVWAPLDSKQHCGADCYRNC